MVLAVKKAYESREAFGQLTDFYETKIQKLEAELARMKENQRKALDEIFALKRLCNQKVGNLQITKNQLVELKSYTRLKKTTEMLPSKQVSDQSTQTVKKKYVEVKVGPEPVNLKIYNFHEFSCKNSENKKIEKFQTLKLDSNISTNIQSPSLIQKPPPFMFSFSSAVPALPPLRASPLLQKFPENPFLQFAQRPLKFN